MKNDGIQNKEHGSGERKSTRELLANTLLYACVYFTAVAMVLLIIQAIIGESSDAVTIYPLRFILIFPYALLFSAANTLLSLKTVAKWLRVVCHYLATVMGFLIFMYLPASFDRDGSAILVAIFIVTVLYIFAFLLIAGIRSAIKKNSAEHKKYDSMFK